MKTATKRLIEAAHAHGQWTGKLSALSWMDRVLPKGDTELRRRWKIQFDQAQKSVESSKKSLDIAIKEKDQDDDSFTHSTFY